MSDRLHPQSLTPKESGSVNRVGPTNGLHVLRRTSCSALNRRTILRSSNPHPKNACHKKYHNSAGGIPRWEFRSTTPWKHKGEGIASCVLKFQARWRWVISITSRPLYPRERVFFADRRGGWVGFRAGMRAPEKLETDLFRFLTLHL